MKTETLISQKEHPILFSTPMVQAILEGRKTQTRRIVKPQPDDCSVDHKKYDEAEWKNKPVKWSEYALKSGRLYCELCGNAAWLNKDYDGIKCPYGKPGDLLWVRETWGTHFSFDHGTSNNIDYILKTSLINDNQRFFYNADGKPGWGGRLRPSIHMPKAAARIWLQVENIRVERVQDISEADAKAEGVQWEHPFANPQDCSSLTRSRHWCDLFSELWKKINGRESWDENPWVWVIEFKVISTNGKP